MYSDEIKIVNREQNWKRPLVQQSNYARLLTIMCLTLAMWACGIPNKKEAATIPTIDTAFDCIDKADVKALRETLKRVENPNGIGKNGETLLYHAIRKRKLDCVNALLDANLDIEGRSKNGASALLIATGEDLAPFVKALLNRGANPNAKMNDGRSALHLACQVGNLSIVRILLDAGSDVCAATNDGRTPLSCAQSSLSDQKDQIISLLQSKAPTTNTTTN